MPNKAVVSFLDILGFNAKVKSIPLDELSSQYEKLISQARSSLTFELASDHSLFNDSFRPVRRCSMHVFSDSIILYANDDSDAACLELLLYTWRLQQLFLAVGMPLRGAVQYGGFYANPKTGIHLGEALSEAYRLESRQEWIGISIGHSVPERYPAVFDTILGAMLSGIFPQYSVPMKSGCREDYLTVNWRFNLVVEQGTRSLFPANSDAGVKTKISNTLEYAKMVVESKRVYAHGAGVPVELRTFFVGGTEPPFPHGDDM